MPSRSKSVKSQASRKRKASSRSSSSNSKRSKPKRKQVAYARKTKRSVSSKRKACTGRAKKRFSLKSKRKIGAGIAKCGWKPSCASWKPRTRKALSSSSSSSSTSKSSRSKPTKRSFPRKGKSKKPSSITNNRLSKGKSRGKKGNPSASRPTKRQATSSRSKSASKSTTTCSPRKRAKKEDEEQVWKWWEEGPREDGVQWKFLQHKGPLFTPPYEKLPRNVHFKYNGKVVKLSLDAEEVAGFYSRFIKHDCTKNPKFNQNFFTDWRKVMTSKERRLITNLKKCDFRAICEFYQRQAENRKAMTKQEKLKIKEKNQRLIKEYGIAIIDGHKEKIGNFRVEPPGLFMGRGDHPKMGMVKKRVRPEDVIINCSRDSKEPKAPKGSNWKRVKHDNKVTWLACWTDNIQGQIKYIMLNPTSRLKGEKDWLKYEKAGELAQHIDQIRENYREDLKSEELRVRQRAVALYFIDHLALRAGNEKDEDEADTVGCCSLRYEHIQLARKNVVILDFLGKDSIRYHKEVPVEKSVYQNLKSFMEDKEEGDDLFDRLNTAALNKHLNELMNGLTAKVFRTYNASHTLQQQLDKLTPKKGTVEEMVSAYNKAIMDVAVLCNHKRTVPKTHEKSMENLDNKISSKKNEIKKVKADLKRVRIRTKEHERKTAQMRRLTEQLRKLERSKTEREKRKDIAIATSKVNYLDPRISVAWCKKYNIPIEKVYNKAQRDKFRWAIDMADRNYRFG